MRTDIERQLQALNAFPNSINMIRGSATTCDNVFWLDDFREDVRAETLNDISNSMRSDRDIFLAVVYTVNIFEFAWMARGMFFQQVYPFR